MTLESWIVNLLVMSIPPLAYVCVGLYKDNKKKKEIIRYYESYTKLLQEQLKILKNEQ